MIDDEKLIKRFTDKIKINEETGCWEWTAAKHSKKGYGSFGIPPKQGETKWHIRKAHQAAWLIFSEEPIGDKHVLHRCDNPSCVNPAHLWLGTNQHNVDDKMAKGRHKSYPGVENGNSKLTVQQVLDIKKLLAEGVPANRISKGFNICKKGVLNIKWGISYRGIGSDIR